MPWQIVNKGGEKPFCLVKKGETTPIPGGCHAERKAATEHLQALYSSESAYAVAESFIEDDLNSEFAYEANGESAWEGYIAFENVSTGDNRSFASGSITWGDLPIPLLWQKQSSEGHSGSWVIGRVDHIEKQEGGKVFARGVLLNTPEANEYKVLLESGSASGVSIDGDTAAYTVEEGEEKGQHKITFSAIRVRALTAVPIPAFADAKISLLPNKSTVRLGDEVSEEFCDDITPGEDAEFQRKRRKKRAMTWSLAEEGSLTAAALVTPPSHWFDNQILPGPTPLTVLENGQVFGHIALWGTCHIGMPACTAPPKGGTYAYFHTGALTTLEGDDISVGHLTFNTGHASVYDNAFNAASHYDHTGAVAADVVAGEDKYGIWVSGSMRSHLTEEEVRIFKSAPISGDWRRIGARLELVAALSVNTPGFPVPRNSTRTKVLVAGGQEEAFITLAKQGDFEPFGRQAYKDDLVSRVVSKTGDYMYLSTAIEEEDDVNVRLALKAELAKRALQLSAETVTFNLGNLESALDHVEDAIDALEGVEPNIGAALSDARAAESALKRAVKKYGGESSSSGPSSSSSPSPSPSSGPSVGVGYAAETETFNLKHTRSALNNVSDAVSALEAGNVSSALSNLRDAESSIEDSIDAYDDDDSDYDDNGYVVVRETPPAPPSEMSSTAQFNTLTTSSTSTNTATIQFETTNTIKLEADTHEFATCRAARKRVSKARRSLTRALRAYRNCTGVIIVQSPPPEPAPAPPPPPAASADTVQLSEDGFPASDFALVPDASSPSTWKLRLTSTPGGDPDPRIVGAAIASLGKGFRGSKVELSEDSRPQVIAKVRAAFLAAKPDRTEEDLPPVLRK